MIYLLILLAVVSGASQSIFAKGYSEKTKKENTYLYSAVVAFVAMLFFVITSGGKLNFAKEVIIYSVGFAVAYSAAIIGQVQAVKCGMLSISSMISQCALIIPTLYGLAVLGEDVSVCGYIGIAMIFVAMVLASPKAKDEQKEKTNREGVSIKWFIWSAICFVGNGMCSVVQKTEQLNLDNGYKNEFMIGALAIAFVIMFAVAIISENKESENKRFSTVFRGLKEKFLMTLKYAPLHGVANGVLNMLVLILLPYVPSAILFPVVIAGEMVITFIASITVFKEKLAVRQIVGYVTGMAAIVLVSI